MPTANTCPAGSYSYSHVTESWTWSEELFTIHGFTPGEVVPSTDLLLVHKHPDDRALAERVLREALATGERFAHYHRVLDARGREHVVLAAGEGTFDASGALVGLRGHMVDVTAVVRRTTSLAVDQAVAALVRSRPVIEQAKGGLMLTYGLDAQTAFQVLRGYSQVTNVKVREVATDLVASMARGEFPAGNAAVWETVVAAQVSTTAEPKEQAGSRGADDPDPIL